MQKKKLVLVNPTLSNPFPGFPPLGLGYVAALTPGHWDVEIIDENFDIASYRECDLVGITGFTAMANRAYQVARMFREKNVPVVMGGIHASMVPEEALQYVDAVVIGEAESIWGSVIADFEAGLLKREYIGTHTDLTGMVVPRRDLFNEHYLADSIQTARGCPNDCEFCSVSQFNGFAYRQRPIDEVIAEMATLKKKFLFIVDDNIAGLGSASEERLIALTTKMVERKLKKIWYGQAGLNVADNDMVLNSLHQSGCILLLLGIESENRNVLKTMKKNVNIKRNYDEVFKKIHRHRIGIHGSFICGTDEDTPDMLNNRFNYIIEKPIDVVQYCTSTPYPGTNLFNRLYKEGRLFYTDFPQDWDRYDLTEVLFKPRYLDTAEYTAMMKNFAVKVFSWKHLIRRFIRTWRDTGSIKTAIWCYFTGKLYKPPVDREGEQDDKLWYLSPDSWPFKKHMNQHATMHKKHYLRGA